MTVSRDKLDSILEIYYLMDVLGVRPYDPLTVLDIGAGYGRLAHRFTTVFARAHYYCADAVPLSTFLCEFYLRYRRADRTYVVPLHELHVLEGRQFDFAITVHSFREQTQPSISFWMDRLDRLEVTRLVVVDHDGRWATMPPHSGFPNSYFPILQAHGWRMVDARPKFRTLVGHLCGLFPETVYSLFAKT